VLTATPAARARAVRERDLPLGRHADHRRRDWVGFLLSGRSARTGYVQRLAVDPRAQRHGVARALLDDAFAWFTDRHCDRALVNTDVSNVAALALYHSSGFHDLPERLRVYEGPTTAP
jgi:ribosomal protein S18 acetylase RimI-like enzyme